MPQSSFKRDQRRIGGFAVAGFAGEPHAVDHEVQRHALLRVIEHDRRGPVIQPFGQDFPREKQARRLPRGDQPGVARALVRIAGENLDRRAGLVRIALLRSRS